MADKSNFTPDEWKLLLESVTMAGIAITALGLVPTGAMIRRAGARPGDAVFVSGTIGDAGGGLAVLKGEGAEAQHAELVARYRVPEPRLALGHALRGIASAALDVSDGLIADLGHMAKASGVGIEIARLLSCRAIPTRNATATHAAAAIAPATQPHRRIKPPPPNRDSGSCRCISLVCISLA